MMTTTPLISEFTAIGELKNLTVKSNGRVKYLLLSTENQEYSIKLPKEQPKKLIRQLHPGCQVKITGILTSKVKKNKTEYKAHSIKVLTPPTIPTQLQTPTTQSKARKSKKAEAKVLICKKSNCWKKGGKETYEALAKELENRGIAEQVDIKLTGCLKKCKKAPNMVVLPDKEQYTKVKPKQIGTIVEQHLAEIK